MPYVALAPGEKLVAALRPYRELAAPNSTLPAYVGMEGMFQHRDLDMTSTSDPSPACPTIQPWDAVKKYAWPKMPGIPRDPIAWRWPTHQTAAGAIAQSFPRAVNRLKRSLARKMGQEHDYRLIKEIWAF